MVRAPYLTEIGRPLGSGLLHCSDPDVIQYVLPYIEHCLSTCLMLATWHHTGRLTCLVDSLAWQTHYVGRITCLADSFARQTHLPGRLTCLVDSLAWKTHLLGRITCLADSLSRQTHLPNAKQMTKHICSTNKILMEMELCREACWVRTISTG